MSAPIRQPFVVTQGGGVMQPISKSRQQQHHRICNGTWQSPRAGGSIYRPLALEWVWYLLMFSNCSSRVSMNSLMKFDRCSITTSSRGTPEIGLVSGGGARSQILIQALSQKLGFPCEATNPFGQMVLANKAINVPLLEAVAPQAAIQRRHGNTGLS